MSGINRSQLDIIYSKTLSWKLTELHIVNEQTNMLQNLNELGSIKSSLLRKFGEIFGFWEV